LEEGKLTGQESGVEACPGVECSPGQALSEWKLIVPTGCGRSGEHEIRLSAATLETPGRHSQSVLPTPDPGGLDDLGEGSGDSPGSQTRNTRSQNVTIDWVGETDLETTPLSAARQQAPPLQTLD
jgi:hypothetical protein